MIRVPILAALALACLSLTAVRAQTADPNGLGANNESLQFTYSPADSAKSDQRLLEAATDTAREEWRAAQDWADQSRKEVDAAYWRQHELEITDGDAFRDQRLISIERVVYSDGGGAHPNMDYGSLLWDEAAGRQIGLRELFVGGALPPTLRAAWREQLAALKQERGDGTEGETVLRQWLETSPLVLEDTPFVLARSTVAGKAGGIVFLHAPYKAGAYAEGDYRVVTPLSAFADALKPAYRDSFAGAPVPEDR